MKRNILAILALSLSLASCESSNQEGGSQIGESSRMSSIDVAILENNQSYVLSEKYRGDEKESELKYIVDDSYDVPLKKSKILFLLQAIEKIDWITDKSIALIADIKKSTLNNAGCKDCIVPRRGEIRITKVDISKLTGSASDVVVIKNLSSYLFDFAKEVSSTVASSRVQADENGNVQYI
ncbi:MAG: hypothetical protein AB8B56_11980, partial [Crocinitomicaceae bacterium]